VLFKDFGRRTHFVTDENNTHTDNLIIPWGAREKQGRGKNSKIYKSPTTTFWVDCRRIVFYSPPKKLPKFRKTFFKKRKCRDEEVPSGLWPTRGSFFANHFQMKSKI
jgi:hypothetical protein